MPISELTEDLFVDGAGFDGSSIRGFQQIHESDMLLVPDPSTAIVDPVYKAPTLSLVCNIVDPITKELYSRDPRYVAQKAEQYLLTTGLADTSYWGPEAEFFIFKSLRFGQTANSGFYYIDSEEGIWNSGADGMHSSPGGDSSSQPRVPSPVQGRLLPGATDGQAPGPPHRHGAEAHRGRH